MDMVAAKGRPLDGVLTTEIVVDREGQARDVGSILTNNPGVSDAA